MSAVESLPDMDSPAAMKAYAKSLCINTEKEWAAAMTRLAEKMELEGNTDGNTREMMSLLMCILAFRGHGRAPDAAHKAPRTEAKTMSQRRRGLLPNRVRKQRALPAQQRTATWVESLPAAQNADDRSDRIIED